MFASIANVQSYNNYLRLLAFLPFNCTCPWTEICVNFHWIRSQRWQTVQLNSLINPKTGAFWYAITFTCCQMQPQQMSKSVWRVRRLSRCTGIFHKKFLCSLFSHIKYGNFCECCNLQIIFMSCVNATNVVAYRSYAIDLLKAKSTYWNYVEPKREK